MEIVCIISRDSLNVKYFEFLYNSSGLGPVVQKNCRYRGSGKWKKNTLLHYRGGIGRYHGSGSCSAIVLDYFAKEMN